MTREEAIEIARGHLDVVPLSVPDYRWVVSEPRDLGESWFFEYRFEHVGDLPKSDWESFGGAPGFIVPKDGAAPRDLSWEEYDGFQLP